MHNVDINGLIELSERVGQGLMAFYSSAYDIHVKSDRSPVTTADKWAHAEIVDTLEKQYPHIPIISEENTMVHALKIRAQWKYFFLIDPLDGTKEFIKKNGEFTINIALIYKNKPILGLIYVPATACHYFAVHGQGAYKRENCRNLRLPFINPTLNRRYLISRSHICSKTEQYIVEAKKQHASLQLIPMGSALKFCKLAEGSADVYLRYTPTKEWDTAAGHIIAFEAGKNLRLLDEGRELIYNKPNLINPGFIIE